MARRENYNLNHYDALKKITAENWINNTLDKFGGFDSVINCSGVLSKVPFLYKDGDEEDILNTLNINFLAIWNLCRLSWDHLCTSGRGRIICFSFNEWKKIQRGFSRIFFFKVCFDGIMSNNEKQRLE